VYRNDTQTYTKKLNVWSKKIVRAPSKKFKFSEPACRGCTVFKVRCTVVHFSSEINNFKKHNFKKNLFFFSVHPLLPSVMRDISKKFEKKLVDLKKKKLTKVFDSQGIFVILISQSSASIQKKMKFYAVLFCLFIEINARELVCEVKISERK
jgi:hypothetical protein